MSAYTKNMKFFVQPTQPPKPYSSRAGQLAWGLAAIYTLMAVAQLFTFDEFTTLADAFQVMALPGMLVAALFIVLEVLSLPYLLRMAISPLFRLMSGCFVGLTSVAWLCVSLWIVVARPTVESIGYLGGVGQLAPGWWSVCVSFALTVLSVWVLWGTWPRYESEKTTS